MTSDGLKLLLLPLSAALAIFAVPAMAADDFPSRPVRMIIPSGAGGVTDILGRVLAPRLTQGLGQQVVVDNRPGASGIVGSQIVAKSAPDGYTLLMVFPSHPVNATLYPDIPYDTVKAFAPITMVSEVAPVMIVQTQFPAKSIKELIAIAREKPGQLNHGSVGNSSMGHLGAELFRSMTGIKVALVTYKGAPQVTTALLSGEIQFYLMGSAGTAANLVKAGRVRAIGVGAKKRIAALPDVPSISETLPGYEARGWNGILAPAATPRPVIDRLHREIVAVVRSPEFAQVMTSEGATAVGNTPAEFDAIIRADLKKWATIIRESGIKPE